MNCRVCHLVDEYARNPGTTGTRTYADFARRGYPMPIGDTTRRGNSPLRSVQLARGEPSSLRRRGSQRRGSGRRNLHGDLRWLLPDERAQAVAPSRASSHRRTAWVRPCPATAFRTRRILAGMSPAKSGCSASPRRCVSTSTPSATSSWCAVPPRSSRPYMRALGHLSAGRALAAASLALQSLSDPHRGSPRGGRDGGRATRAVCARRWRRCPRPSCSTTHRACVRAPRSGLQPSARTNWPACKESSWPSPPPRRRRRTSSPRGCGRLHRLPRAAPHFTDFGFHDDGVAQRLRQHPRAARSRRWRCRPSHSNLLATFRAVPDRRRPVPRAAVGSEPGPDDLRHLENMLGNDAVPSARRRSTATLGHATGVIDMARLLPSRSPASDPRPARPRPVGAVLPRRARLSWRRP